MVNVSIICFGMLSQIGSHAEASRFGLTRHSSTAGLLDRKGVADASGSGR